MITLTTEMDESQRQAAYDTMLFMVVLPSAVFALFFLWLITSGLAISSLRSWPRLLTQNENEWKGLCGFVWVPFIGPGVYLLRASRRRAQMNREERLAARQPFRRETALFIPQQKRDGALR